MRIRGAIALVFLIVAFQFLLPAIFDSAQQVALVLSDTIMTALARSQAALIKGAF